MAARKKLFDQGVEMSVLAKVIKTAGALAAAIAGVAAFFVAGPALAQTGAYPVKIDMGGDSAVSKSIVLPLNKAAIVELPRDAADVLVSQPAVVDAVVRSPRRVYLLGLATWKFRLSATWTR